MSRSALIIIDVQLGMYNGEKIAPIFQGEEKIKKIARLIDLARKKGLVIVYVCHVGETGHPLEPGTNGFELHPGISPDQGDIIIEKKTPDSFLNTSLSSALNARSIKNVYITGNQTDFCIDTTCKSAWAKDLNVVLIGDCHSTWDSGNLSASQIINHHNYVLSNGFASVVDSNDITFEEY